MDNLSGNEFAAYNNCNEYNANNKTHALANTDNHCIISSLKMRPHTKGHDENMLYVIFAF